MKQRSKRARIEEAEWLLNSSVQEEACAKWHVIEVKFVHYQIVGEPTQHSFFIDPRGICGDCGPFVDPCSDQGKYIGAGEFQTTLLEKNPWIPEVINKLWPKHVRPVFKPSEIYDNPPIIIDGPGEDEDEDEDEHALLLKFLELAHVNAEPPVCVSSVWKITDTDF